LSLASRHWATSLGTCRWRRARSRSSGWWAVIWDGRRPEAWNRYRWLLLLLYAAAGITLQSAQRIHILLKICSQVSKLIFSLWVFNFVFKYLK
jgi:hypothetical protein